MKREKIIKNSGSYKTSTILLILENCLKLYFILVIFLYIKQFFIRQNSEVEPGFALSENIFALLLLNFYLLIREGNIAIYTRNFSIKDIVFISITLIFISFLILKRRAIPNLQLSYQDWILILISALKEELLFRYFLCDLTKTQNILKYIIIAGIFSISHDYKSINSYMFAFISSLILQSNFENKRNVTNIFLSHFIYNAFTLLFFKNWN